MQNAFSKPVLLSALLVLPAAPAFAQDLAGSNLNLTGSITQNGINPNFFNGSYSSFNGNACIGNACLSSGESNGPLNPPLKLKWAQTSIIFEDTSTSSFPTRDWRIQINDSSGDHFSIIDEGPDWTLENPVTPFRIVGGAPENSLWISGTGNMGQGTANPLAPLHVYRADATQELLLLESDESGDAKDRAMLQLINNGGIRFQFDNPALGTAWRFQAATGNQDSFEVTKVGTGVIEFRVDANGNATLAGMLFENSDRHAKTNIETINPQEVLARLTQLPISEWEYKDTPGQRHVGPMAQDFHEAFGLGANDTSLAAIDTSGIALASIKALAESKAELTERIEVLANRNQQLEARLAKLESVQGELAELRVLVAQWLPQVAQK